MCFSLHQLAYNATVNVQIIKTGFFPFQWFLEACVLFSFWLYAGYLKINFSTFTSALSTYLLLISITLIHLYYCYFLWTMKSLLLLTRGVQKSEAMIAIECILYLQKQLLFQMVYLIKLFFFIIIFSELSCAVSPHKQLEHQANNNIAFCIKYTCENWKNNKKNTWLICVRHRDYIYFQLTESQQQQMQSIIHCVWGFH